MEGNMGAEGRARMRAAGVSLLFTSVLGCGVVEPVHAQSPTACPDPSITIQQHAHTASNFILEFAYPTNWSVKPAATLEMLLAVSGLEMVTVRPPGASCGEVALTTWERGPEQPSDDDEVLRSSVKAAADEFESEHGLTPTQHIEPSAPIGGGTGKAVMAYLAGGGASVMVIVSVGPDRVLKARLKIPTMQFAREVGAFVRMVASIKVSGGRVLTANPPSDQVPDLFKKPASDDVPDWVKRTMGIYSDSGVDNGKPGKMPKP
jgi:hypothetical protein